MTREEVIEQLAWVDTYEVSDEMKAIIIEALKQEPSVQPKKAKGEWLNVLFNHGTCSVCGERAWYIKDVKYCPNCGAEMEQLEDTFNPDGIEWIEILPDLSDDK